MIKIDADNKTGYYIGAPDKTSARNFADSLSSVIEGVKSKNSGEFKKTLLAWQKIFAAYADGILSASKLNLLAELLGGGSKAEIEGMLSGLLNPEFRALPGAAGTAVWDLIFNELLSMASEAFKNPSPRIFEKSGDEQAIHANESENAQKRFYYAYGNALIRADSLKSESAPGSAVKDSFSPYYRINPVTDIQNGRSGV